MRSTEDQLLEIMKRADHIKEKKADQKALLSYALSACACILLMVVTVLNLPRTSSSAAPQTGGHYGSLLLDTSYMGYIVIGVLAFLLGISVTLLCLQLRKIRKKESERT